MKKGKTIQNYDNNSRALEELINNKWSYNDRTGISYKVEEEGPSTTKYNEPMRSDMHVDFIGQDSQEQPWKTIPRWKFPSRYQNIFYGYFYSLGKFCHNVARTLGTNIIPGDLSNMNLPGLSEISIDLNI